MTWLYRVWCATRLLIAAVALLGAFWLWTVRSDLDHAREQGRLECEARNRDERALRELHAARASYYSRVPLAELGVFEQRYLETVGPLPDCG